MSFGNPGYGRAGFGGGVDASTLPIVNERWFLVPAVDDGSDGPSTLAPKYRNTDGVSGYSGTVVSADVVESRYPNVASQHPDVDEWFVARFYGLDQPGSNALTQVASQTDVQPLPNMAADVKPILDGRFPDAGRTAGGWSAGFRIEF